MKCWDMRGGDTRGGDTRGNGMGIHEIYVQKKPQVIQNDLRLLSVIWLGFEPLTNRNKV